MVLQEECRDRFSANQLKGFGFNIQTAGRVYVFLSVEIPAPEIWYTQVFVAD